MGLGPWLHQSQVDAGGHSMPDTRSFWLQALRPCCTHKASFLPPGEATLSWAVQLKEVESPRQSLGAPLGPFASSGPSQGQGGTASTGGQGPAQKQGFWSRGRDRGREGGRPRPGLWAELQPRPALRPQPRRATQRSCRSPPRWLHIPGC